MNVYDFDGTIFRGDSTTSFIVHCLKRKPRLALRVLPSIGALIEYARGRADKTAAKERLFSFLSDVKDIDHEIERFWDKNISRIEPWYRELQEKGDVVISASPMFLVEPACARIGVRHVIASPVNPYDGKYHGVNCDGEEKVRQFQRHYPGAAVDRFYSDSDNDLPMARLAREAFKVRRGVVARWTGIS